MVHYQHHFCLIDPSSVPLLKSSSVSCYQAIPYIKLVTYSDCITFVQHIWPQILHFNDVLLEDLLSSNDLGFIKIYIVFEKAACRARAEVFMSFSFESPFFLMRWRIWQWTDQHRSSYRLQGTTYKLCPSKFIYFWGFLATNL